MKNLKRRTQFIILGIAIIIVGLISFGGYKYYLLKKESREQQVTIDNLRDTIQSLEGNLSLTEYERDKLSFVLKQTEEKAGELEEKTSELNDKVSIFEKLNTLDPELLKKYSKVYFLNEHYTPSGLIELDDEYVNGDGRQLQLHEDVWPYMKDLLDDSREEGLELLITSAYRSFKTQATLKAGYRVIYGAGTANQFSADQGYSEHQLGTTVDFTTVKTRNLSSSFDKTPEFKWLTEHAHEYGFVMSYPKANKYYIYEPWHWRFVGVDLASMLHDEEKTLYGIDQREIDEYLINIFD